MSTSAFLRPALLVGLLLLASQAGASVTTQTTQLLAGTANGLTNTSFGALSQGEAIQFSDIVVGTQTNDFTFSLPTTLSGQVQATSYDVVFNPFAGSVSVSGLQSLALQLYTGSVGAGTAVTQQVAAWGANGAALLTFADLAVGQNYYLEVSSVAAPNTVAASFLGAIAVSNNVVGTMVTAVPEPGTWAMMGAGVAALLLISRRRKLV